MIHDTLNEAILKNNLKKNADGLQILVLKSCPSTNTLAREMAINAPKTAALIVAEQQTAGRGRLGRQFHSPEGAGVYFSVLFPGKGTLPSAVSLTCAASVAVMRAIRNTTEIQTEIKWVNDLLHNGKKVCGILTEAVTMGNDTALIVGIGINLRPTDFPKELQNIAGSLNQTELPRSKLIAEILAQLLPFLNDPDDRSWLEDYRSHSCVIGKEIFRLENGSSLPCLAESIDSNGRLVVRYPNGQQEALHSGEISIRLK